MKPKSDHYKIDWEKNKYSHEIYFPHMMFTNNQLIQCFLITTAAFFLKSRQFNSQPDCYIEVQVEPCINNCIDVKAKGIILLEHCIPLPRLNYTYPKRYKIKHITFCYRKQSDVVNYVRSVFTLYIIFAISLLINGMFLYMKKEFKNFLKLRIKNLRIF